MCSSRGPGATAPLPEPSSLPVSPAVGILDRAPVRLPHPLWEDWTAVPPAGPRAVQDLPRWRAEGRAAQCAHHRVAADAAGTAAMLGTRPAKGAPPRNA